MFNRFRKTIYIKKFVTVTDGQYGDTVTSYGDPVPIFVPVDPSGGRIAREEQGLTKQYAAKIFCDKEIEVSEKDGLCIDIDPSEEPNYRVIAVHSYPRHNEVMAERIAP